MMRLEWAEFSQIGPRESNQDRTLTPTFTEGKFFIVAIADGIGGAPGGAEAATIAVEIAGKAQPDPSHLPLVFEQVVTELANASKTSPELARMGTTLSVILLQNRKAHIAHVGDTRIYHLRDKGLMTLTEDQTEAAALLRKGILRPGQVKRYPRRNVLISSLSPIRSFDLYQNVVEVKIGDRFLLLTDGVHQKVPRQKILQTSLNNENISSFLSELERLVVSAGPSDNYSAVGFQINALS